MQATTHPSPRLHRLADATVQAWRNGGGVTRELLTGHTSASQNAHPTAWDWRISVADITADGPFSALPGVQRWFAVISGAGVRLTMPGRVHAQASHDEPLAFDGGTSPACQLINGPTRDLNLMLRGMQGRMQRVQPGLPWSVSATGAGIYTSTACTVSSLGVNWPVPAEALLWFDEAPASLVAHVPAHGPAWWLAVGHLEPGA